MVSLKCYIFITIRNKRFCHISFESRLIILLNGFKTFYNQVLNKESTRSQRSSILREENIGL